MASLEAMSIVRTIVKIRSTFTIMGSYCSGRDCSNEEESLCVSGLQSTLFILHDRS
jgi:hypothetical protein